MSSAVLKVIERHGLDVLSVDNLSEHYFLTLDRRDAWNRNRDAGVARYGERAFRIWNLFLAWVL